MLHMTNTDAMWGLAFARPDQPECFFRGLSLHTDRRKALEDGKMRAAIKGVTWDTLKRRGWSIRVFVVGADTRTYAHMKDVPKDKLALRFL